MRANYRLMLACPPVKAAFSTKVYGVAAQDLRMRPASKSRRDGEIADFCKWNLTERLRDCVPGLIWSILSGGLTDGYSVCERGWELETSGDWAQHIVLDTHKAKDVDHDLVLQTDAFRNVVGVLGLRYNGGRVFAPASLTIWKHFSLYDSPTGLSDLRAAYSSFWMRDTLWKLRGLGATSKAFPILWGEYQHDNQRAGLEAALEKAKSSSWLAVPQGVRLQALEVAGSSEGYFSSAIEKLDNDIILSIEGAYLQAVQGTTPDARGNAKVADNRSDVFKWWLSASIQSVLNDRKHGLVRDMTDLNYVTARYPWASLSAIDSDELLKDLQIDEGLLKMGLPLSREELYDRYSRVPPQSPDDALKAPEQQAPGMGPGAPGMPPRTSPEPVEMAERLRRRWSNGTTVNGEG